MATTRRYCLILILLFAALTGYGQNQRMSSLQITNWAKLRNPTNFFQYGALSGTNRFEDNGGRLEHYLELNSEKFLLDQFRIDASPNKGRYQGSFLSNEKGQDFFAWVLRGEEDGNTLPRYGFIIGSNEEKEHQFRDNYQHYKNNLSVPPIIWYMDSVGLHFATNGAVVRLEGSQITAPGKVSFQNTVTNVATNTVTIVKVVQQEFLMDNVNGVKVPYQIGYCVFANSSGSVSNYARFRGYNPNLDGTKPVVGQPSWYYVEELHYSPDAGDDFMEFYWRDEFDNRQYMDVINKTTGIRVSSDTRSPWVLKNQAGTTNFISSFSDHQLAIISALVTLTGADAGRGELRVSRRGTINWRNSAEENSYSMTVHPDDTSLWFVSENAAKNILRIQTLNTSFTNTAVAIYPVTVALTADNQTVNCTNRSAIELTSDSATATSRTFVLTSLPAAMKGQTLRLYLIGTGAAEIADNSANTGGGNNRLSATKTFGSNDVLNVSFNGVDWMQDQADND